MNLSRTISRILLSGAVGILLVSCNDDEITEENTKPETPSPEVIAKFCHLPNSNPAFDDGYASTDLTIKSPLFKYSEPDKAYSDVKITQHWTTLNPNAPLIEIPDNFKVKKHQIRSTWIATIANLTMPKSTTPDVFKAQFDEYLQTHKDFNMNALIFQVRPLLDAYYPSEFNPVSEFLSSGKQGENAWDFAEFDPLQYMIEATHAQGMEYHAWFNPYRVTNTKLSVLFKNTEYQDRIFTSEEVPEVIRILNERGVLADNNFAVLNPNDVYLFDEKLFLNPSRDSVIQHVTDTIKEVVSKYDIDAIHFDDYFYPYRITVNGVNVFFENEDRQDFLDSRDPALHPDTLKGLEAWRRDNITRLITNVKTAIDDHNQQHKTAVQFGISPFGIWEHKQNNPEGSYTPTGSSQSYSNSIYADSKLWTEKGYVDYIIPQIYWSFEENAAPYGELAVWWNNVVENAKAMNESQTKTQLYIGHANYKYYANSWEMDWANPEEIPNQIRFNQTLDQVDGSVYFSYNELMKKDPNAKGEAKPVRVDVRNQSIDLLKQTYTTTPVLPPSKPWLDHKDTDAPIDAKFITTGVSTGPLDTITWADTPENDTRYYVIYRGLGAAEDIFANPQNIVAKVWRGENNQFEHTFDNQGTDQFTYLISAVDAAQNESDYTEVKAAKEVLDSLELMCEE